MLRVAILGATGRMGELVLDEVRSAPDLSVAAAVARSAREGAAPVTAVGEGCFGSAEVVVDFSLPAGLAEALPHVGRRALVSGTTGLDEALHRDLRAQAERAPVLVAANFSLGIHVLRRLVAQAVSGLRPVDVEVVETHHRHKVDAPSGTALALVDEVAAALGVEAADAVVHGRNGKTGTRPAGQIGVHALRGGDVAGEHSVHLLAHGERLVLSHAASGRRTFAKGAIRVARWLAGKPPGWYTLDDMLGSSE